MKYKNDVPGQQHDLVIHPYEYVLKLKNEMKFFGSENAKKIITKEGIMYLENRYVEIKNSKGEKEYILQPLLPEETNSIWFEKMAMDELYGKNNQNLRFYYDKSLIGKEKRFKSLKELKEFFERGLKNE